ncbi:hypothetical protein M9458_026857, partial [Cirrhinus mrigala]
LVTVQMCTCSFVARVLIATVVCFHRSDSGGPGSVELTFCTPPSSSTFIPTTDGRSLTDPLTSTPTLTTLPPINKKTKGLIDGLSKFFTPSPLGRRTGRGSGAIGNATAA